MSDMLATIVPKSDQLNADDLLGGPRTIKITRVEISPGIEQPVSLFFDGDDGKPYKACKSMRRVLVQVWGADAKAYAGRRMTIYCDPGVVFGGQKVGGIRISHMSHIDSPVTMALTATRANRKPYTVRPLVEEAPAERKQTVSGWLDALAIELEAMQSHDEVVERIGKDDVQKALGALKGNALDRLNSIIRAAHVRTDDSEPAAEPESTS